MIELFDEASSTIVDTKKEKTKYAILNVVSITFYVLFGISIIITILNFNFDNFSNGFLAGLVSILIYLLPVAFLFFSAFFFGKFRSKFYNEYDYSLVSGSLRFSKVIMNKKRKFLFKFECSDIEKIGKYGSVEFEKYDKLPNIKRNILTSNTEPAENKNFYYLVVTFEGEKHLIIIECEESFIVNILKFTNIIVWEKEHK